jgi:RES domain-containing protein
MKLWRLTCAGHTALGGTGTLRHGARYSPPGVPVVNFASEAGLAVLVAQSAGLIRIEDGRQSGLAIEQLPPMPASAASAGTALRQQSYPMKS